MMKIKFPDSIRRWIITMISSSTFTLNMNSYNHGFFQGGEGIRQGDLVSPLIFVLVMEYLTRTLQYATTHKSVKFHPLCKDLKLLNLCFADDLMIFCKAHAPTVQILMEGFQQFSQVTGLQANSSKSQLFIARAPTQVCFELIQMAGFSLGTFPIKYLGIPLSPKRWKKAYCDAVIKKITKRIQC